MRAHVEQLLDALEHPGDDTWPARLAISKRVWSKAQEGCGGVEFHRSYVHTSRRGTVALEETIANFVNTRARSTCLEIVIFVVRQKRGEIERRVRSGGPIKIKNGQSLWTDEHLPRVKVPMHGTDCRRPVFEFMCQPFCQTTSTAGVRRHEGVDVAGDRLELSKRRESA